jgi:phosphohistidine phosphatase SixA
MTTPALPHPDRRRRRKLRLIPVIGYALVALVLAYYLAEQPTTTTIFVRHADTDTAMATDDPSLNERGRQRAELLADFLQDIDVVGSVNAIYASDKRRTQETAAPLAKRLGLEVQIADHQDVEGFMARVKREHSGQVVLVVSHSNTIAPLIAELHGSKRLPPIEHDDYDEVYVVSSPWPGKVKTYRLHYPEPPLAEPAAVSAAPSDEAPTGSNGR